MNGKFEEGFRTIIETESAMKGLLNDMTECGIEWRSLDLANEWTPLDSESLPLEIVIDTNGQLCYGKV